MTTPDLAERSRPRRRPSAPWRAAHVFALCGFAVAQPLFGLLGGQPDFWIARQASTFEVAVLIAVTTIVIPAILVGLELIVGLLDERAGWITHLVVVGVLGALVIAMPIDAQTNGDLAPWIVASLAFAVAIGFAMAYQLFKIVQDFLSVLVIAPVIFVALFVYQLPPLGGYEVPLLDSGISESTPVVMVVFDEFQLPGVRNQDGTIDDTRYPGLARLATMSTWYSNATTVSDDSLSAVPAILSGEIPAEDQQAVASDYPVSLFTALGSTHAMFVNEDITRICPPSICASNSSKSVSDRLGTLMSDSAVVYLHTVAPSQLRHTLPDIGARWGNFLAGDGSVDVDAEPGSETARLASDTGGESRAVAYGEFLDSFDPSIGPALYYLHVDVPHVPWTFVPSGARYPELAIAGKDSKGFWTGDSLLVQQGYVRAALNAGFTDQLVSDTVDRLVDLGLWDEALVVFVADHGQHFGVNEARRSFTDAGLVGLASVPLFIKYPHQDVGVVDTTNAQTIDVLPTIVDVLGGTVTSSDGHSLMGTQRSESKTMVSSDGTVYSLAPHDFTAEEIVYRSRMLELAPAGVGYRGMFESVGPRPDLFDYSVDSLLVTTADGEATLADESLFENFDPSSHWDPIAVQFQVVSDSRTEYFAVAVNGTILATAPAYRTAGSTASVLAIVPPGSFRAGDNVVEVFGVEGDPGDTILIRFE